MDSPVGILHPVRFIESSFPNPPAGAVRSYRSPLQKIRRLLKLLECLQSGQDYNGRELAELCGVSRRQIFRDLKTLQESGVEVLYDNRRQSYRVTQVACLPATALTLQEALSLLVLSKNLGNPQHGIPLQEPARDAAVKIYSALPIHLRSNLGELIDRIEIRAGRPTKRTGSHDLLNAIHKALRLRQKLRIKYHSLFEGDVINTLISPYRLLFYRHAWYIVARSSLHRAVRMFHLGRVESWEATSDSYEVPRGFSLARHLGNAWQLIRERGKDQLVRVRFQPLVATNVNEVLWHKTQRTHWNPDGTLDFEVKVSGLGEISWWILGYGDQAEVLEPEELREQIASRARSMAKIYRKRNKKT